MTTLRTPWDSEPPAPPGVSPGTSRPAEKRRGRRTAAASQELPGLDTSHRAWRYHHLTISGPAADVLDFTETARGSGVVPWRLDGAVLEEDLFNLAASQARRSLSLDGCRILARQFRDGAEARNARAMARVGQSRACPLDLHTLLPVPGEVLQLGSSHPAALAWLTAHWGTTDTLRHVARRQNTIGGRQRAAGDTTAAYGFYTADTAPAAAIISFGKRWPMLCPVLTPQAPD